MRVSIVGYGRSGKAAAALAKSAGYEVFVSDIKPIDFEGEKETGHSEKILDADLIVVSPGIRELEILEKARDKVIGEIEFAYRFVKGDIIGVTGTNGKTTTASLIHSILQEAGYPVSLCGNIYPGIPMSQAVLERKGEGIFVVELSSFQLEGIREFRPKIGIITNITLDHMDRYEKREDYVRAKERIFMNKRDEDIAVLNGRDGECLRIGKKLTNVHYFWKDIEWNGANAVYHGRGIFAKEDVLYPAEFFVENALAASLACLLYGVSDEYIKKGIRKFRGVPHRLEFVREINGVKFINNSMCTNPVAFYKTIKSFPGCVVIAGGKLKGMNPELIVKGIREYAKGCVLIGESKEELERKLKETGYNQIELASSMRDAVRKALGFDPELVILSPGGSSFDMFRDFVERGEVFKKEVLSLGEEKDT